MTSPCVGEDNRGHHLEIKEMEWQRISTGEVQWLQTSILLAFLGPPLALEGRETNAGLSALSIKNIYISKNIKVWTQKVRNMLLKWAFQAHPWAEIHPWISAWVAGPCGGSWIRAVRHGRALFCWKGTSAASAWSLGLEGALGLGHTTKYPPAPNPFILLCICWEPERKDGDFGMAAKRKGIPHSQKGGCDLCWCCASSFLSTYLQLPGIQ